MYASKTKSSEGKVHQLAPSFLSFNFVLVNLNPVILSIPLYFLLIGIELIWEARKRKGIYRLNDALTNISCGISSQVTNALWGVISIAGYQYIYEYLSLGQVPVSWWTNIILFLLVDFMYYWYHRASHEINFLWNVSHVVHHQSEDYNLSVALRQASFGGIFSMFFYLPLAFLGFNTYAFIAMKGFNLIYQFWIHTEAINRLPRWFELIFNTPSHHRVHHGRNPKYIDRNHAGTLIIWDRMFGTFQEEEEKPTYGVTKPIQTWNPVWANVLPVVDMTRQVLSTPGVRNKLKVLFYKPGWFPASMGGYRAAPEIKSDDRKFSTFTSRHLSAYLLIQYLILLGLTALFLFNHATLLWSVKLIYATYLIITILSIGLLLENRSFWKFFELLRNLSLPLACWFYFESYFIPALLISLVLTGWYTHIWNRSNA